MVDFLKFPGNSGHLKCIILVHALCLFFHFTAEAQDQRILSGQLIDSLHHTIAGADIYVITPNDTLNAVSDNHGRFSFTGIHHEQISLLVMSVGYKPLTEVYQFPEGRQQLVLDPLVLHSSANLLNEVVISAKDRPVTVKKDTISYDASFYQLSPNDRVEDLLRQLPGVEVDAGGNATAMGRPLLKLRVNGEDFFTNSVKDFISQLPASVIAKLEIINDYGDEANFTGVKTGEPQKMLNLVTKAGQNKGTFGNIAASAGTHHRYGLQGNGNLWEDSRQIGFSGSSGNTSSESGINTSTSAGLNYRDKLASGVTASAGYTYAYNKNISDQLNFVETINTDGTIYNQSESKSRSADHTHNINFNIQSVADKGYFQASLAGSMANRDRTADGLSSQTGLIRQDLLSKTSTVTETPSLTGNFVWARGMMKPGRSMSASVVLNSGINQVGEVLGNRVSYYNRQNGVLVKDSLVNRFVDTENRTNNASADFRYSEPLRTDKDSVVRRNIDFAYSFSASKTRNSLYTRVNNSIGNTTVVDSLSSLYASTFITQKIAVSYRYQSRRLNYSAGLSFQPSQLKGHYEGNTSEINHVEFNFAPILNLNYNFSDWDNLTFIYTGSSSAPDFYQLQPVPNITNLQNIIIGNPELKSSFTHSGNLSWQHTEAESGATLQLAMNGSLVRDQVVSNVILIGDTLNSLKQETHFKNADGSYLFGGLYSYAVPFGGNKFNVELRGTWDYVNMVSYANDLLNRSRNINYTQTLRLRMNRQRLSLSGYGTYSYTSNRYSIASFKLRNTETWEFNLNGRSWLNKRFAVNAELSKRINSGYALNAVNPLLINLGLERAIFKNGLGTVALKAYDLLNQGNNLVRSISDNSITDSRYNQITRYFLLSFNYRLQNFGRK